MNNPPLTQDDRYQWVVNAIWFSAQSYVPRGNGQSLLALIDVNQAAHMVVGMLDDLELLPALPSA